MMYAVILSIAVVGQVEDRMLDAAKAILTAYNANREALANHGTIRYRFSSGTLAKSDLADLSQTRNRKWDRLSSVEGTFAFDGSNRIILNEYPLKDLVARRKRIDDKRWSTEITAFKALSDGSSTFFLSIQPDNAGNALVQNPSITSGTRAMFQEFDFFPLDLGDPTPKSWDMGGCLGRCLGLIQDHGYVIKKLESHELFERIDVVKIETECSIQNPPCVYRDFFWVDLARGAIPVRSRSEYLMGKYSSISEIFLEDLEEIPGVGWFPRREIELRGGTDSDGNQPNMSIRELQVISLDLTRRPDASSFLIEYPDSARREVIDNDRRVIYPARKVWDLSALSSIKRGTAGGRRNTPASPASIPEMPGEYESRSPWGAIALIVFGIVLVLGSVTVIVRKLRNV